MRVASRFSIAAVAFLAVGTMTGPVVAQPSAPATAIPENGCDGPVGSPVDPLLRQAQNAVNAGDERAARSAIETVVTGPGRDAPYALLRAAAITQQLGDGARAEALRRRALAVAGAGIADGGSGAGVGRVYAVAARLLLGPSEVAEARRDLALLRATPDADRRWACHLVWVAQSLADAGDVPAATTLLDDVRRAAPSARSVTDAAVGMAFRSNDRTRTETALRSALAAFPGDVEFTVRLANHMKITGRVVEARALLEAMMLQGEASPSLLGELLGMVSGNVGPAELAHFTALAAAHPELPALQMMVGVEHHYLHQFEASNTHLLRTGALMEHEPRIAMYVAMNYFRLGDQARAEDYIARATAADRPDPDIDYCRAVIRVRQDPQGALADLRRYLAYTRNRPDVDSGKQARVQQTLALLEGCVNGPDARGCVEREVVEQARALAFREHYPGTSPQAALGIAAATGSTPLRGDPRALEHRRGRGEGRLIAIAIAALVVAALVVLARRRKRT